MNTQEDYINLKEIFSILKKRIPVILAVAILATALAWAYTFKNQSVSYTTTTDVMFNTEELTKPMVSPQDSQKNNDMLYTYMSLIKSPRVLDKVAAKLNMENEKSALAGMVSADNLIKNSNNILNNSNVITITVTGNDAQKVVSIANTVASTFKEEVKSLLNIDNVIIVSPAKDTVSSSSSKTKTLAVGFLLGLILGSVGALMLEYFNKVFRNEREIEKALNLPVLVSVRPSKVGGKLVAVEEPTSPLAETYRTLRTEIQYASEEREVKSILVASALKNDGKTEVAANLAVVNGEVGLKTLYIQADLRSGKEFNPFGVNTGKGLSTYLSDKATLDEVIQKTDLPHVAVLPAGPVTANPSELITPQKIEALLQEAASKYDRVIIESPAVDAYADGLIIGRQVDGCLYAIGKTGPEVAYRGIQKLRKTRANLLGVVFNKTR